MREFKTGLGIRFFDPQSGKKYYEWVKNGIDFDDLDQPLHVETSFGMRYTTSLKNIIYRIKEPFYLGKQ